MYVSQSLTDSTSIDRPAHRWTDAGSEHTHVDRQQHLPHEEQEWKVDVGAHPDPSPVRPGHHNSDSKQGEEQVLFDMESLGEEAHEGQHDEAPSLKGPEDREQIARASGYENCCSLRWSWWCFWDAAFEHTDG